MATPLVSPKFYAWHPDTGKPLAFGTVYTYAPGSTDFKPTYQDEAATIENANPVPLNAAGYASIYLVGSYRIVVADKDDTIIWEHDPVSDITPEIDEWLSLISASYVSPVSFTVSGDQRELFSAGRAIKIIDDTEFIAYAESATYSSEITTVIFYSDQAITAGISAVRLGIVSVAPLSNLNSGIALAGGRASSTRRSALYASDEAIGGTPDFLDGIDGLTGGPVVNGEPSSLQTGDIAFVGSASGDEVSVYIMDASSGESADGEDIVAPVSNAGLKRWKRKTSYVDMDKVYPVGMIVSLYVDTNPATLFGVGTWELHGVGKVPVCVDSSDTDFNAAGKAGGVKDVTLTAAQSGLPAHGHDADSASTTTVSVVDDGHAHGYDYARVVSTTAGVVDYRGAQNQSGNTNKATTGISVTATTNTNTSVTDAESATASEAHTNLQPYICEYRWRRIA